MFCFRNVNVETCVGEKVGKKKDVLVETWIGTAQVFVTVGRNRLPNYRNLQKQNGKTSYIMVIII